jgi:hypothetical protein
MDADELLSKVSKIIEGIWHFFVIY